ncbi:hypothetical protein SSX86_017760 [Deinandra increscens subsp. villosa]|uniref:BHLH domain-containing protein n=1 Tax=Deinandra increscens subsp. villosa TaxID=3103831 RepID=A0AAP0D046_9ASTR
MEGFQSSFHTLKPSSFTLTDIEQNMELLDQYSIHNYHDMNQNIMGGFSNDNFICQQQVLPSVDHQFMQCFQPVFDQHEEKNVVVIPGPLPVLNGKRKSVDVSSSSSGNSSSYPVPESEIDEKKYLQRSRKGKKVKASDSSDSQKDVVHVRARRGQATDSHSIAERVRRGKINERFRCLQDIVPGCYKSMGMAVMLDEIINYVQSLQNQVEFLSMKLTEASSFPNLDSDLTSIGAFQMGNMIEGMKMQRVEERGPFDQSFGSSPSLPYHTT